MEQGNHRENQASNLKKILADINAQEMSRKSLLSDDESDVDYPENPHLSVGNNVASKDDVHVKLENKLNPLKEIAVDFDFITREEGNTDLKEEVHSEKKDEQSDDDESFKNDGVQTDKDAKLEIADEQNDSLTDDNQGMKTISPLYRKANDYVPYGHYEEVTSSNEDVVFYDSEQFQQYVQRRMATEANQHEATEYGVISKKIKEHSEIANDGENSEFSGTKENIVNFSKQDLEINTLNLPPRREVHRNSRRKMTFQVNKSLFGFVALLIFTFVPVICLFVVGGEEVIDLFQLKSLFYFFL